MDGITQVGIQPYEEWIKENEVVIDLLKVRYARKGVTLTDQEAWQYLAWATGQHEMVMRQIGGAQFAGHADQIKAQVAQACADHFTVKRTGVLPPPSGPKFDQPMNFNKADMDTVLAAVPDNVFKGYL